MQRRGGKSCAGCSVLLAIAGILSLAPVKADIMDAMPAFVSRPVRNGMPLCAPTEELCPLSLGSDDLHCVDLTDPKTCGGCVVDGEGLDCTSVPGVFMQQCTSRGQCTGCRWKHGGMNASLEEPDFLSCSIILTQPVQASRHRARHKPQLTFAKQLIKDKLAHIGPLAARKPQNKYAADKAVAKHPPHKFDALPGAHAYPGIGPGVKQLPPPHILQAQRGEFRPEQPGQHAIAGNSLQPQQKPGQFKLPGQNPGLAIRPQTVVKSDSFPHFELEDMPEPPHWLTAYTTSQLSNLPLTDSDDAILGWFQSIETGIVKLGVRFHAMSPQEQKKKISNADRFRLKLPPVPPKALVRPNKPAPFILPGMDYTEEEIEALGLQNYMKTKAEPEEEEEETTVTVHDTSSVFWGRLMKRAFASTSRTVRKDVMDALWFLLDTVSRPVTPGKPHMKPAPPPELERAKPGQKLDDQKQFLPKADKAVQAVDRSEQQNAFRRPGQLAAEKAIKYYPDLTDILKDELPLDGSRNPVAQPMIPVKAKEKPDIRAAKDNAKQPQQPLVPLIKNGRLEAAALPKAKGGAFGLQEEYKVPEHAEKLPVQKGKAAVSDGRDSSRPGGKHARMVPLNEEESAAPADLSDLDEENDDPYARERQRPVHVAKDQVGKLFGGEQYKDAGDEALEKTALSFDEQEDYAADQQSLLELLALKQQELADIRRKLLAEHKRKKPKTDQSDIKMPVKAKPGAAVKPLQPLQPFKAKGVNVKDKVLMAPGKDAAVLRPLQAAEKRLVQPAQGRQPKMVPLLPVPNQAMEEETANVFEQHIRKAQKAKVKKLEDQIQPEWLLENLERENLAQGGDDLLGRANNKLMMAGMAKARPGAHRQPDGRPQGGLKPRR